MLAIRRGLGPLAFLVSTLVPPPVSQAQAAGDTLWRYRASADIDRTRECESAELLLTVRASLIALDANTGQELWTLPGLPSASRGLYWPCQAATGLSYRGNRITAFDLVSGAPRWNESSLPPAQEIRGYVVLTAQDLLLLFLRTSASDRSIAAMRLSTGTLLWQRDDLLESPPKFTAREGVSDIAEYQAFLLDTDSTLVLWVNADGPSRLDVRTGATLWRADSLAGPRVPHLSQYAAMRRADSLLIVPVADGVVALRQSDGSVAWRSGDIFPRHVTRILPVEAGILARAGRNFVQLLDPGSGAPLWASPLTLNTDGAAYELVGDRYFLASGNTLFVADVATGDTTRLGDLPFRDRESANGMYRLGETLLLFSRQNLVRIGFDGSLRYARFYAAPGPNVLEMLGGIAPGASFGSAALRPEYAYFVTNEPDASGRRGNSLVRVAVDDGREAGRVWFRSKAPRYFPDPGRDQVLMLRDAKTLVALRFAETVTAANDAQPF